MTRLLAFVLFASACSSDSREAFDARPVGGLEPVFLVNAGTSALEGHTPRGFQGMGSGLFVGDNLNASFPNGDGLQTFLSFDLGGISDLQVDKALLRSVPPVFTGSPLQDLGNLIVEEVRYDNFSSALWNLVPEPGGRGCVLATSQEDPFECDLTALVQSSLDSGYPRAQLRLRLEQAGDGDSAQDMVMFFRTDSNTNEAGLFTLDISFVSGAR